MLKQGVYLAPSPFEAMFISAAHTKKDVEKTIATAHNSLKAINPHTFRESGTRKGVGVKAPKKNRKFKER
jgi:hypothetical protein